MLFHRGERYQAGRGLGNLFGSLFRRLKPLVSMGLATGKRILSSDLAKKIGSTALEMGKNAATNVAVDLLEGKKLSESVNREIDSAKSKIATTLKGGGRKRKKKGNTPISVKKGRFNLLE